MHVLYFCVFVYRAEEIATQQFNAAKKEQTVVEQNKGSFFKRKRLQNHRRSKSLGKVRFPSPPNNIIICIDMKPLYIP